jgi:predicted secreted protein
MVLFIACTKEFIVKDIKNKTVTIIAPSDNLTTPNNSVTFWWEELEGAEKYNLQIVKPSFSSVIQLITDTTVTSNKFTKVLTPGAYQWRIKAINAGGSTVYTTRTLIIDTTSNLSFITLNPVTPIGLLTASKVVTFSWTPHPAANYYELNILNSAGASVFNENNINTSSFTHTFTTTTDLKYSWQVKAHNSFSFSQYNTASTFTVDVTAPSVSSFSVPIAGNVVNDTTSFFWNRVGSDTKYDSIIVSNDSAGISYITSKRVNGTSLKFSLLPVLLPSPGPAVGYYWWRIISVDSVKNRSNSSSSAKFKLTH